ncbi:MAG: DUF3047 domain-containing protein [Gammaproteobacteria bacterium]|nr:DUF3047 domain-containing protein [Gammaproteobacteria bacterium]
MMKWRCTVALGVLSTSVAAGAAPLTVMVGNFASGDKSGWEEQEFKGKVNYSVVKVGNGAHALEARSSGTASGLHKKVSVDLEKTPYINWTWRVTNTLKGVDETTKKGDDYPARIYVILSGGLLFWKTQALNYVWSSTERPADASWPNAYTSSVVMLAVDSGNSKAGTWVTHKRNLREDLKRQLGKDVKHVDAIAVMSDTDNSGQSTTAYYGNIFMSSE